MLLAHAQQPLESLWEPLVLQAKVCNNQLLPLSRVLTHGPTLCYCQLQRADSGQAVVEGITVPERVSQYSELATCKRIIGPKTKVDRCTQIAQQ